MLNTLGVCRHASTYRENLPWDSRALSTPTETGHLPSGSRGFCDKPDHQDRVQGVWDQGMSWDPHCRPQGLLQTPFQRPSTSLLFLPTESYSPPPRQ